MTQPPDLSLIYYAACVGGGLVVMSAVGIAMIGSDKPTTVNRKTVKRGHIPVAAPKKLTPANRCYGTERRWVELQREWRLAHAPAPVQINPGVNPAADDVFVHWFENCIDISDVTSPNNVISYEELVNSYLTYCRDQNAQDLADEDFIAILTTYSTSQGCKFDPNTGELTHGRLKG